MPEFRHRNIYASRLQVYAVVTEQPQTSTHYNRRISFCIDKQKEKVNTFIHISCDFSYHAI